MANPRDVEALEGRLQNMTEKLLSAFEELDFVHTLSQLLAQSERVQDLDDYLLTETLDIFRADGGWVVRRQSHGGLETSAVSGVKPGIVEFLTQTLVDPLAERGALPYLVDDLPRALSREIDDTDRKTRLTARTVSADFPRAFLAVPLAVNDDVLGAICLGKVEPGQPFTAGDQRLLSTLAHQAALFIKNADLVSRLEAKARSLGKRVEQLEGGAHLPDIGWIRGPSATMRRLAAQVEGVAATDATVLLLGESGTGKSLVAQIIHRMSARSRGPLVELNCGAVPPTLIESELFGHARGAFTGADRDRPGLFEEASGGTIFLDEVAELPLESQVKLLTVMEHRRVRRVGENRDRAVDVRVVAATNADLIASVGSGAFREDLYYRLNVLSLTVPPLRERPEDVLRLSRRFLEQLARETNRRIQGFSPAAEEALMKYPWPGNVRELRNVVERSLLLKLGGSVIEAEDLAFGGAPGTEPPRTVTRPVAGGDLSGAVAEFERDLILAALDATGGTVSLAAEKLGISRTNLHNKMKKHGLVRKTAIQADDSHNK